MLPQIADEGNQALQEFLAARNPKQQHSSTLESYLIKPIQRILKYPLLLQQLRNLTDSNTDEHQHLVGKYQLNIEVFRLLMIVFDCRGLEGHGESSRAYKRNAENTRGVRCHLRPSFQATSKVLQTGR